MSVIERLLVGGCDETRKRLSDIVDGQARGIRCWRARAHLARRELCQAAYESRLRTVERLHALSEGRLIGEATGEVEVEDGVLVIKRIHVHYVLPVEPDADREKIQRAFDHHMPRCPVYRSISAAIECTTELTVVDAHTPGA